MKLTNLQKHYQDSFNKARPFEPPGAAIKYRVLQTYAHKPYTNKKANQYAKYMNVQILGSASNKNILPSLRSKTPYMIKVLVHINKIPCTITYMNDNSPSLAMGYNNSTKDYDLYSTVNNTTVLNCELQIVDDVPMFLNTRVNRYHHSFVQTQDLQEIISAYNITDAELTEEQQFQLDTTSDTVQYYISMYQRMYHIMKQLELNPNPSVLQLIRYSTGK